MAIKKEYKRVESGRSLTAMESQANSAINTLKAIKVNVVALKTQITNDTDNYGAEDIADVQSVIDTILTGIAGI